MSEVQRYQADWHSMFLDLPGRRMGADDRLVVLAADFDRVTAERDALQTSLDAVPFNLDKTDKVVLALQQRLAAADERNDEAIDLLRRTRAVIEGGGWADLERDIAYFFKPAEPARCTNCDRATVEQCDDAGCGFLGAGNGAPE